MLVKITVDLFNHKEDDDQSPFSVLVQFEMCGGEA